MPAATPARTQPDLPPDQAKPEAEHSALLNFLKAQGVPAATANSWIGAAASGRTRKQIADTLNTHLVILPKG